MLFDSSTLSPRALIDGPALTDIRTSAVSVAAIRDALERDAGTLDIVVFGAGGDRDRPKRPEMGATAARLADLVVVTSDNPRSEDPADIIDEIVAGISDDDRSRVDIEVDRAAAIKLAITLAEPGDIVIVAGSPRPPAAGDHGVMDWATSWSAFTPAA